MVGSAHPRRRADAGASAVCGQAAGALAGGLSEAGRHYWAARCWTLLVWQPIYLQVLAVRLAGQAPCLTDWRRASNRASSPGSASPDHQPLQGEPQRLLRHAGAQIRGFCEQAQAVSGPLLGLHPAGAAAGGRLRHGRTAA